MRLPTVENGEKFAEQGRTTALQLSKQPLLNFALKLFSAKKPWDMPVLPSCIIVHITNTWMSYDK